MNISIKTNVLTDMSKTFDVWLTDPDAGTIVLHATSYQSARDIACSLLDTINENTTNTATWRD